MHFKDADYPAKIKVLQSLQKSCFDIAFLQGSCFMQMAKFKRHWVGQVFAAADNSKARGLIVLVETQTPMKHRKSYSLMKRDGVTVNREKHNINLILSN